MSDSSSGEDSSDFSDLIAAAKDAKPISQKRQRGSWLFPGEKIMVKESNVGYISQVGKINGTIVVTNYRLRFKSQKEPAGSGKTAKKRCEFIIPLGAISRVDKVGHSTVSRGEDAYGLEIVCKDMRNIKLSSRQENHSRRPLFECLQKHAFPQSNKMPFYAFCSEEKFQFDGWTVYDPVKEYKRMGIPNDTWKLTKINERYEFADTMPALFCVPAAALQQGEEFLQKVGAFRSRARIPVLSWLHPETQASLTRCSQPLVGMTARRCAEDERLLRMISEANAQSPKLYIMDARPEVNAKVNKAKGGGYESEDAYENCELMFLDIQNIHVMRESLRKLKDICYPRVDDKTFLSSLDDTGWLEHIKLIMEGAAKIVDKIENHKTSVLVHCSDGWDRTAQLTCLPMLMLDPYYRTLTGYQILIEKEWCSFGHKFAHRIGHGEDKHSDAERSPVFLQFIDATWQLTVQFPVAFEFNVKFLILILDELYNCRFGTFLYNSELQRTKAEVREKTQSLWSMVNSDAETYTNPLYNPSSAAHVIIPSCSLRRIKLWNEYYLRYTPSASVQEKLDDMKLYSQLFHVRDALRDEVQRLKMEQQKQAKNSTRPPPLLPPTSYQL